ncbi:MAG: hypothetical protein LBS60_11400 [Deltaproteobacteria bacterium]|jgi:Tfp pilus assembly protein PilV|nr:hypothetical protein [Deltaproteobacteria bacterium]
MKRLKTPPSSHGGLKSGFTLLETLFALLVILMGFLAAITMNSTALRSGVINEVQFQAVFLADSKIEEIRTNTPESAGTVTTYYDRNGSLTDEAHAFYTMNTAIKFKTPSAKTDQVTVSVTANRPSVNISYVSIIDHMDD